MAFQNSLRLDVEEVFGAHRLHDLRHTDLTGGGHRDEPWQN